MLYVPLLKICIDNTSLRFMFVSKHQHLCGTFYSFQQAQVLDTAVVRKN